ncbi:DUF6779 domain-containing protein [Blastococcus saxobsidens]|uniref:DUF6779 domain-containing protein n=1 Tax=Blastococcus saxobsidens TaxID=138336 RepID=A0A4Q7YBP9_9ACTN|nr:DUF6779 domain-containing protein [Blastococcus saxobsidens]RZU34308.1 hypothetical protein BKA19_4071 [Blastococcus saxobsidens]
MPRREDDDVARGAALAGPRTLVQAGGFMLAAAATLAVFLTDDARLLRLAVVAVAWAFVLATFAAGRRGADRVRAAAREAELRQAYELELEREVAARREYELALENELRREAEDSMRDELDALRGEIASLADLRDEVARVSSLRGDLAALGGLREEVARVAALREDVAALTSLRGELGQIAALREDMGRLRAELTEQLSSEMLVERITMRTQASRLPGEAARLDGPARTLEGGASWTDDAPPRELTGGWPAIRLDEPRPTQHFEQVRTSTAWTPATPPTTTFAAVQQPTPSRFAAPPPPPPLSRPPVSSAAPPTVAPVAPVSWSQEPGGTYGTPVVAPGPATTHEPLASYLSDPRAAAPPAPEPPRAAPPEKPAAPPAFDRHPRAAAHEADPYLGSSWSPVDVAPAAPPTVASPVVTPSSVLPSPPEPQQPPLDRPVTWSLLDPPPAAPAGDGPRRRRTDGPPETPLPPAHAPTTEHPAAAPRWSEQGHEASGPDTSDRLARILAENGVTPESGGRRRRRYREDGESDDVLARVLGRE